MQDTQEQGKCALLLPCTRGDEAQTKTNLPHLASCLGMHPATGITPKSCRNLTGCQGIQAGGRLSIQPPVPIPLSTSELPIPAFAPLLLHPRCFSLFSAGSSASKKGNTKLEGIDFKR